MKKLILATALFLAAGAHSATASNGIIQTLIGLTVQDGVPALATPLYYPRYVVADGVGNIYFSDPSANRVWRIDGGTGIMTSVAGTGSAGFSGDGGPATAARLNNPSGISYVGGYNEYLYISDTYNQRIRRVDLKTGLIQTIAGNGLSGYYGDGGPAILASLNSPSAITVNNNQVWFVDYNNLRVRYFNVGFGNITTVAGNGAYGTGSTGDAGPGSIASLYVPLSVAFNPTNNSLYIGTYYRVRKVTPASGGTISTVAGIGVGGGYSGDGGLATLAKIYVASGLVVDPSGNVFFSDAYNYRVRRIDYSSLKITTVAGTGVYGYSGDNGPAMAADISAVQGLSLAGNDDMILADQNNGVVRKVNAITRVITTVAGGNIGGGGQADNFPLQSPQAMVPISGGDILVADNGARIWRYNASTKMMSAFLGTGASGWSGDWAGPPTSPTPLTAVTLTYVGAMAKDASGAVYFADGDNFVVRKINAAFTSVSQFAGTGSEASGPDGVTATTCDLGYVYGLACAPGKVYIVDGENSLIRVVDTTTDIITTVTGQGGSGYKDVDLANSLFNGMSGITVDVLGDLYVADTYNHVIRKVDLTNSLVSTVAGLGPSQAGYRGDGGLATAAALNSPRSLWFDVLGNLYIADSGNNRVRKVDKLTGIITTVAGSGLQGFSGDGGGSLLAQLYSPGQGFLDTANDLVFLDSYNSKVRKVSYAQTPTPTPISSGPGKPVAYPSPADKQICFSYFSPSAGKVVIEVYNMAMQLAARFEDSAGIGAQTTCADVSNITTGAYLYRMVQADGSATTGKFKVIH